MSVINATATVECDGCGVHFVVILDTGTEESLYQQIIDTLTGGVDHKGEGFTSYQCGKMLCGKCTARVDETYPDDKELTEDDVQHALHSRRRLVDSCSYCQDNKDDARMPPHDASDNCESGKRTHCTCDICY